MSDRKHWSGRIEGLATATLITLAALLALLQAATAQMELGGTLDCLTEEGEQFALAIDVERGACDFGEDRGRFIDGVCRIEGGAPDALEDVTAKRVTVDEGSGALLIVEEETGQEIRGVCGPG